MQFLLSATFAALAVAMPPSYGGSVPSYGESSAPAPQYKVPATTPAADYPAAQTSAAVVPVAAEQICTVGWSAQCCEIDVLGLAALTCKARMCPSTTLAIPLLFADHTQHLLTSSPRRRWCPTAPPPAPPPSAA